MNDQTSPTAGGQGPGSSPWRDPFQEPRGGQGLPGIPPFGDRGTGGSGLRTLWHRARPDVAAAVVLVAAGTALGAAAGLLWYRFAPTVWLSIPADAVSQVKSNVDQSALLVSPEAKGIASVDGYFFVATAVVGLLLGTLGFWLGQRGFFGGGRDVTGERNGAGVGAWAGVLLGGLAGSSLAAALGRWVSLPDPVTLLHTIAAGHPFHAPVALHARSLMLAAPLLGTVLFLALTAAFTKPAAAPVLPGYQHKSPTFFSPDNPYGFRPDGVQGNAVQGNGTGTGPGSVGDPAAKDAGRAVPEDGGPQTGPTDEAQQAGPSRN